MRICFIADATSIHVKRIVSYYVAQKDTVLILSTGRARTDIGGARIIDLIAKSNSAKTVFEKESLMRRIVAWGKSVVPHVLKEYIGRSTRDLKVLRSRNRCLEEIAFFRPEALYCHRSFPEGVLAARCGFRPLLLRTAGADISRLPRYPIYRQLIRNALQSSTVVVTESLWEKEWLRRLCGSELPVEVNIIGIDVDLFRPARMHADERSRYDLPQDAFVVICNRYLTGHYNGWSVVEAIESVLESCPKLHLFYVNPIKLDGRDKEIAGAIVRRFSRIRFLEGPVAQSEMANILRCGDLYVSFASYDGIPNSVLEAMSCGLVPVVAELPQLPEWIEHGVDGYVLPQGDIKGLASLIGQLYERPGQLRIMGERCVEKIRARAGFESCSQRTRELIESIARKSTHEEYADCSTE